MHELRFDFGFEKFKLKLRAPFFHTPLILSLPSFLPHTISLKKIGMNYKLVWVWNIRPQLDWLRCAVWKAKPQCERTWARTKADGENHASQQRTTHKALSVNKMNCEALKLGLKMGENKERIKLEERHSSGRHATDGGKASENEESKNNKMISGKSKLKIFELFTLTNYLSAYDNSWKEKFRDKYPTQIDELFRMSLLLLVFFTSESRRTVPYSKKCEFKFKIAHFFITMNLICALCLHKWYWITFDTSRLYCARCVLQSLPFPLPDRMLHSRSVMLC